MEVAKGGGTVLMEFEKAIVDRYGVKLICNEGEPQTELRRTIHYTDIDTFRQIVAKDIQLEFYIPPNIRLLKLAYSKGYTWYFIEKLEECKPMIFGIKKVVLPQPNRAWIIKTKNGTQIMKTYLRVYVNNYFYNDYPSPNVHHDFGEVCWGRYASMIKTKMGVGDIDKIDNVFFMAPFNTELLEIPQAEYCAYMDKMNKKEKFNFDYYQRVFRPRKRSLVEVTGEVLCE